MKKALLSLLAVVLGLSVMAQTLSVKDKNVTRKAANTFVSAPAADCHTAKDATPTWKHIHTPFTTTDINSNTIDVAAILASGKAIVIDYSATWCNPCYQFHQSKNLEAIHDALSENVVVLWVEADNATTLADIEGTGNSTQGDWTHYSDGSAVSYPIIDCASCESMIDPTGYVPAVYFIAPSGYYCHIYAESWGFGISTSNTNAVAAVQNLLTLMPQSGDAPTDVAIVGKSTIPINTSLNLTAQYVSVDAATVSWSFPGGTPTSATGNNATVTYSTPGTYTVTLEVDNGNGNVSCTLDVQVISCPITDNPYNQDFEETLDDCWIMLDADGDSYTWMQGVFTTAHGGSGNIASASYINYVGALEPDNWLISPKISLPAESAQISWWDYGNDNNDYAEHYGLYVSTSGTNPSDFTLLWEGDVQSAKTWRQLTQSLNDYCGQDVYIAFRHFNCTDMYWLLLDDMKVSGTGALGINDVDQTSVIVYPNPTTGRFHITAEGFENVEVYDVTGRNVMNTDQSVIDLSAFANGVYTLRVNTVMGSSMQKIVKK